MGIEIYTGANPDICTLVSGKHGLSVRHYVLYHRQQNGCLSIWMCGEICGFGTRLLPWQARQAAVNAGCGQGTGNHTQNDARIHSHIFWQIHSHIFWQVSIIVFILLKPRSIREFKSSGKWSYQRCCSHHHASLTSKKATMSSLVRCKAGVWCPILCNTRQSEEDSCSYCMRVVDTFHSW